MQNKKEQWRRVNDRSANEINSIGMEWEPINSIEGTGTTQRGNNKLHLYLLINDMIWCYSKMLLLRKKQRAEKRNEIKLKERTKKRKTKLTSFYQCLVPERCRSSTIQKKFQTYCARKVSKHSVSSIAVWLKHYCIVEGVTRVTRNIKTRGSNGTCKDDWICYQCLRCEFGLFFCFLF